MQDKLQNMNYCNEQFKNIDEWVKIKMHLKNTLEVKLQEEWIIHCAYSELISKKGYSRKC